MGWSRVIPVRIHTGVGRIHAIGVHVWEAWLFVVTRASAVVEVFCIDGFNASTFAFIAPRLVRSMDGTLAATWNPAGPGVRAVWVRASVGCGGGD